MKDIKIDNTMKSIADGLERVNNTIEEGLKKVEYAKQQKPKSWKESTLFKILKVAAKGILLAPFVWAGLVLGTLTVYGICSSIAFGMNICLKFLGF